MSGWLPWSSLETLSPVMIRVVTLMIFPFLCMQCPASVCLYICIPHACLRSVEVSPLGTCWLYSRAIHQDSTHTICWSASWGRAYYMVSILMNSTAVQCVPVRAWSAFSRKYWQKTGYDIGCPLCFEKSWTVCCTFASRALHDDVMIWKCFQHYWLVMREIQRSSVTKYHWCRALKFCLLFVVIS